MTTEDKYRALLTAIIGNDPEMPEQIQPIGWLDTAIFELNSRGPGPDNDDPDAFYFMVREVETMRDKIKAAISGGS